MKKLDSNSPKGLSRVVQQMDQGSVGNTKKAETTAPTTETAKTEQKEPTSKALAAQKVVLGGVDNKSEKTKTAATQATEHASKLQGKGVGGFLKSALWSAIVATTLLGAPSIAKADTVFLDHNNAPKEILVAKQLAASKHEPFILVRPDAASLEALFAKAEKGEVNIRHLILSGHSSGQRVWGEGSDGNRHETSMDDLKNLKAKYPKAFAQVQHVTFMSCYAGSAGNSAQWAAVFQNSKIAGFWGSGPSKEQAASGLMLKNSEMSMRGLDGRNLSPAQALIEAKKMASQSGSNVTKFAVRLPTNDGASVHFSLGETVTSKDVAQDRVNVLRARTFDNYMSPTTADFAMPPKTHAASPLRDYYNALHAYLNVLPANDWSARSVQGDIDVTIRLIYFDVIQTKMQSTHGATFAAADSALKDAGVNVSIGDVSKLNRMQLVQLVDSLDKAGEVQWNNFATKNAADLTTVNDWLKANGKTEVSAPDASSYAWSTKRAAEEMMTDVSTAPQKVQDAAKKLQTALTAEKPTSVKEAQKLLDQGLKQLSPDVIPSTWIE